MGVAPPIRCRPTPHLPNAHVPCPLAWPASSIRCPSRNTTLTSPYATRRRCYGRAGRPRRARRGQQVPDGHWRLEECACLCPPAHYLADSAADIDLTSLIPQLDTVASDLVAHQRDTLTQRKDLAQKTKDFRKLDDQSKLNDIKALLKGRLLTPPPACPPPTLLTHHA